MTTAVDTKVCSKCGVGKPVMEYGVDRKRPDGRRGVCNVCRGVKARRAEAEPHKTCGTCHEAKPLTDFPIDRHRKDGYRSQCRDCMLKTDRARAERRRQEAETAKAQEG